MTRRPRTPRNAFERKWHDFHTELHDPAPLGYRRQPKGRRAKSGQWWRRPDPWLSKPLNYRERQSVKKAARMRPPERRDWREVVRIDEAADPIPMDVLQRCEPRMAGGKVAWAPSGRDTSRTDTTLMEALRRSNEP